MSNLAVGAPTALSVQKQPSDSPQQVRLKEHCREFEALLVQNMFKTMRQAVPDGGLFEKNSRSEMFRDLIDIEVARSVADEPGLGVARELYRQLSGQITDGNKP